MKEHYLVVFTDTFDFDFDFSVLDDFYQIRKITSKDYKSDPGNIDNRNTIFIIGYSKDYKSIINSNIKFLSDSLSIKKSYYLIFTTELSSEIENDARDCVFSFYSKDSGKVLLQVINFIFDKIQYNDRIVDYIVKSFNIIVNNKTIERQKKEIEKLYSELEMMSRVDYLTNVLNRKALFDSLEAERKRTLRDLWRIKKHQEVTDVNLESTENMKSDLFNHLGKFSCLMIDIDFFKAINDNYGHLIGDIVLKKIGEILTLRGIFRENDIIGRFGGEEFIAVLPATNAVDALIPAERLQKAVRDEIFSDGKGGHFNITLSIGISQFYDNDKKSDDIIERADKALYHAKETGRNRIVSYEDIK